MPGDLDQVIGAAAEEMEAVGVAHKAVAGIDPSAVADGFRGLVRPVPVQRRGGIAAYPQDALFVVADLAAVLVFQTDFIAGHAQPGGAELFPLRPVAEIDVQHFGRSQPFDDLKSGEPLPAVEDFGGKYLGGGQRQSQRGEVRRCGTVGPGQRGVEGRQSEEHGGTKMLDRREDRRWLRLAGQQQRGCAGGEGEGDGIAEAIGEEDLRHREADVAARKLQHLAGKCSLAIGHVVMQMNDALGSSGRSRGIHPERHLVAVGVGFGEIGGETRQPCIGGDGVGHRMIGCGAVDDDERAERRILAGHRVEAGAKLGIGDGHGCAGIRQVELQQVGRRQRVDQQRHEAGAHRAEKRGRIGRRVVEEHQDAITALHSQRPETMSPPRRLGAEFGVAAASGRPDQCRPLATPRGRIVEQDAARIVAARKSQIRSRARRDYRSGQDP